MKTNYPVAVSIIVPVYNTHEYIATCVSSIQAQTFTDWEAILIDDGSTDGSSELCDRIAAEDPRFRVIHQANAGLSAARNAGIQNSRGEFVTFVDSDDFVHEDFLNVLITAIWSSDADVAAVGILDQYGERQEDNFVRRQQIVPYEEFFRLTLLGEVPGSVCNRLYRRSALGDNLRFRVGMRYEDMFFTADGVGKLENVALDIQPLYVYRHRGESITTEPFTPSALDLVKAAEFSREVARRQAPRALSAARFRALSTRFVVLDRLAITAKHDFLEEKGTLIGYIRSCLWDTLREPAFHWSRKVAALALYVSWPLYRMLVRMKMRSRELE
ncbi:MAG: glycosyltransferase family 2 protein [Arcanobacterium sp.]|nr:glycosyltransferase family 2 protein [Arcanobacterium sp.]